MTAAGHLTGLLPLDKPEGPTSHDLVGEARKVLGMKRIGHTGTLDPFASGLLLLLLGRATRLAEYLHDHRKSYRATAVLGRATQTDDRDGEPIRDDPGWPRLSPEEVEEALASFRGTIRQRPPSYSAKKVGGERVYRKARRGERVELPEVEVTVHRIGAVEIELPRVTFDVTCSTGTYIRALARDLGVALGVGAHLSALRRTAVGPFRVEDALRPGELGDPEAVRRALVSPARALEHLPRLELGGEGAARFVRGQFLFLEDRDDRGPPAGAGGIPVAVVREGELLGVGIRDGERLRPRKVLVGA